MPARLCAQEDVSPDGVQVDLELTVRYPAWAARAENHGGAEMGNASMEGQRRAADILRAIREENRRYDETTRHGASEGPSLASSS